MLRDLSRWGYVNAVTAMAQKVETYDRQVEMEDLGGKLAQAPVSEWNALAAVTA